MEQYLVKAKLHTTRAGAARDRSQDARGEGGMGEESAKGKEARAAAAAAAAGRVAHAVGAAGLCRVHPVERAKQAAGERVLTTQGKQYSTQVTRLPHRGAC